MRKGSPCVCDPARDYAAAIDLGRPLLSAGSRGAEGVPFSQTHACNSAVALRPINPFPGLDVRYWLGSETQQPDSSARWAEDPRTPGGLRPPFLGQVSRGSCPQR